jgi:hypothetical protein
VGAVRVYDANAQFPGYLVSSPVNSDTSLVVAEIVVFNPSLGVPFSARTGAIMHPRNVFTHAGISGCAGGVEPTHAFPNFRMPFEFP